jgi:uncharacterized protein
MSYRTPGVYVEEISLFPPSVAAAATAIPAFVGHTARVQDAAGQTLLNRPIRLRSLLDYTEIFGGDYAPASYTVQVDPAARFAILRVTPVDGRRYYLFDAVRHYFDNGGGPCYVVSVGDYAAEVGYGTDTTGLRGGLRAIEKVDEVTILVVPDAVALRQTDDTPDFAQVGNLHKDMLAQCARLQDRFAILDLADGYRAPDDAAQPILQFRNQVGTMNLHYAAAYYPWLYSTYESRLRFEQLDFVDAQTPPVAVPDATLDAMTGNATLDALTAALRARVAEEERIFSKVAATTLGRSSYAGLRDEFARRQNAVLAAGTNGAVRAAFGELVELVRQLALAFRDIQDDAGNSTELTAQLSALAAAPALTGQLVALVAFEKNAQVRASIAAGRTVAEVETDYAALSGQPWIGGVTVDSIASDSTGFGGNVQERARGAAVSAMLRDIFAAIVEAFTDVVEDALFRTDRAEAALFAQHPFFRAVAERVDREMSLLPPSGAVAGVYAATDRSRGVWKAPANVGLRAVVGPAYKLTDQEQGGLNVHTTGKSINAIRPFTGKGVLVWGARTLAGNDNEWRYVNVRRFFTFVETSTKRASEPFVFEPNDAKTWVRARAMIENFLTLQWRQGALAGATPREAFYVRVGLGETMTALDILEGRMIVEIGMAVVRPAEFIVLRFSHKMQES